MGPLDLLDYAPPGRFGREPEGNAWVELHNLVAAAVGPHELGPEDLDRISRRRGVDLRHGFLAERLGLYQRVLDHRIAQGQLTEADRREIAHLARTLALAPNDLRVVHERTFGKAVSEAIADERLSVEERLLLYTLQHTLDLDPAVADAAYGILARERLLLTVARALCDGSLSPDEAAAIQRVRGDLSVELPSTVEEMLGQAAARWHARQSGAADVLAAPACWRRVFEAERRSAQTDRSGGGRSPKEMVEALRGRQAAWEPLGSVGVAVLGPEAIVCEGEGGKRLSFHTIERVHRYVDTLFLQRTSTDWLLRFARTNDAKRFEHRLRTALRAEPEEGADELTLEGPLVRGLQLSSEERLVLQGPVRWGALSPGVLKKMFSERPLRDAYARGHTTDLRVPEVALAGGAERGHLVLTPWRFFLVSPNGAPRETFLMSVDRVLEFLNGVVIERGKESVFVDAGALNGRLARALAALLAGAAR